MKIEDIADKNVTISKSTVSIIGENGKTAGMITNITTFYNVPVREQFEFSNAAHKLGVDRKLIDWSRMFRINGKWYYLLDESKLAKAYEYRKIDGIKPISRIEDAKVAAVQFGAVIIPAASIHDGRKFN